MNHALQACGAHPHRPLSPLGSACNRGLDRALLPISAWARATGIQPHAASWGLAIVALPLVAAVASRGWVAPLALVVALLAYLRVYMPLKRRLIQGSRRKLLLDLTLFVAPAYMGLCGWGGLGLGAATDALAFVVASGIVVLRSGCFLAGCCRGARCRVGAQYPGVEGRFVPLPLFELAVGLVLLGTAVGMCAGGAPTGTLLAPLAGVYAGYRFFSEFGRARSGRYAVRRIGGLSMTQWLCAILTVGLLLVRGLA